jgi:hypothetical protein
MLRAGLKILIKDALRGARDQVRRSGEGALPLPGARRLSRIADDVLSSIEETVVTVRYGSDQAEDMVGPALYACDSLRAHPLDADFEAAFASALYRLVKALLHARNLDRSRISERSLAVAGHTIRRALEVEPGIAAVLLAADIAIELVTALPVRDLESGDGDQADPFIATPNEAVALAIGLTLAAWFDRSDTVMAPDCLRSAGDIVAAAFPRFKEALGSASPRKALGEIYAELAPFAR